MNVGSNAEPQAKAAHTPGPWHTSTDQGRNAVYAGATRVCVIDPHFGVNGEEYSNARLIAAAPETAAERDRLKDSQAELLAELNLVHATLSRATVPTALRPKGPHVNSQKDQVELALKRLTAAIAKAEGLA